MATQVREKPAGKHDAFVTSQLEQAVQRIRNLDLATSLGGWLVGTLAYAVLMMVLDRAFVLPAATRQTGFFVYLALSACYLYLTLVRPLRWPVNRYYAARQLEGTLPGSRNHVVNWLDLHHEKVPGVIRTALGQRAAKDLDSADLEQAISGRRAVLVGALAGVLFVVFVGLLILFGPGPFRSLFGRAFAPFGKAAGIATRTQVAIVRPEKGDVVVSIGSPVTIVAEVDGRVPDAHDKDAPCLLYRHDASEPYRKRFLERQEPGQQWTATVNPLDVGSGFSYKVTAGDAETPEYRVTARAAPLIADFVAIYRYRPYVQKPDRSRITRKIEDLRGTEVHVLARTNRVVKDGRLDFEGRETGDVYRAEVRPDDPQALRFRLVLDRPGRYRIRFTSQEGETYQDSTAHDIVVLDDHPPEVRLTEPGKDVSVPANGHLELVGEASDDVGIAALTLRLQVVGGPILRPMPYLADKFGKTEFGTPKQLDYRDLVELSALRDEKGERVELRPGAVIEYWLEAADACDHPRPNTATSQRFKILVTEPKNDGEQKKQKEEAQRRQKEQQGKQEKQLKNEKAERDQQRQKEEQQEREEARRREEKGSKGKDEGKKDEDKGEGEGEGEKPRKDEGAGGEKGGNDKQDEDTRRQAEQLKDAMDRRDQEKGKDDKEKAKQPEDGEKKPGEGKGEGEKKPGENKERDDKPEAGKNEGKAGEAKEGGGKEEKAGEKKDPGGTGNEQNQGQGREGGKPDPTEGKGQGKEGGKPNAGAAQPKPGEGKPGEPKPQPRQGEGKGKGPGQPDQTQAAGEKKAEGDRKPSEDVRQGEAKDSKTAGQPVGEERPAEKKDGAKPRGEKKGDGKPGAGEGAKATDRKPAGDKPAPDPTSKDGSKEGKPGAGKDSPNGAQASADGSKPGEVKGSTQGPGDPKDATRSDVERMASAMKNGDRQGREQAKRDLADVRDRAQDGDAREAASKALEEAKKDEPGQGKPGNAPGRAEAGENKSGDREGMGGMGKAKGKDDQEGGGAEAVGKAGKGQEKEGKAPRGQGKGRDDGTADLPGDGAGNRKAGDRASSEEQPARKEKPVASRASTLQLEEFRKKVDRDVLKDMQMSPEQFEKFLRDYADLARRQEAIAEDKDTETLPEPGRSGPLPTMGGKAIKRTGPGKDDVRSEGRPKPPPEYRDSFADFLRKINAPSK